MFGIFSGSSFLSIMSLRLRPGLENIYSVTIQEVMQIKAA
jgi:hypothetical protein